MLKVDTQQFIEVSDIEEEISQHLQVTVIDSGTQVLPYQSLSPEQFECLLWDLFRSGYECDLGHDYTRLMLAGADQGRDVWLTCQGRPVGLVQCKRYAGKFSRIEVLKEIIKFLLHADLNHHLLPKPQNFTFYLSLSTDPKGEVDEFFNTPKSWLSENLAEIERAAKVVIGSYASFQNVELSCAMPLLVKRLQELNYKLIRPHELNRALAIHSDVRDRHFRIPGSSLDTHELREAKAITDADLAQASRQLICWQKTIENRFIERPELGHLLKLVESKDSGCYLLTGVAGAGKSSLLSALYEKLSNLEYSVLAIKADELDAGINDLSDLSQSLKLSGHLTDVLLNMLHTKPLVLIIDQMDAISEVMDQSSSRFRVIVDLILSLKSRFESLKLSNKNPIHIIASSRPFEASFDTRFTMLEAKHIELSLPTKESVEEFLADIGISSASVPDSMYPAIQVPFALNLYVSLIKAGDSPSGITSRNLLQRWLEKKLTDRVRRIEQMEFLKLLAQDMVKHEVLRRPINAYEFDFGHIIAVLEAAGILVRYETNIGFSHQAWLDDFQAQSFRNSLSLCDFVYRKQNGLFSRSTILRGIEYLRENDPHEYQSALHELLFEGRSRRHILHLLVDVIAIAPSPDFDDVERIQRLIKEDSHLAKRLFSKIAANWDNWRDLFVQILPDLMAVSVHREGVMQWLAKEALHDEIHVVSLINRLWSDKVFDELSFWVLYRAEASSQDALDLVGNLLKKIEINESLISRYVSALSKSGRIEQALPILIGWLNSVAIDKVFDKRLYGLNKLAQHHSLDYVKAILPWVQSTFEKEDINMDPGRAFRRSISQYDLSDNDYVLGSLCTALLTAAKECPAELLVFIRPFLSACREDIQVMLAMSLAANGVYFAQEIYNFLLEDDDRLRLGCGHFDDAENVGYTVYGSCTMQLIEAAAGFWEQEQVASIRDTIEKFSFHQPYHGASPKERHLYIGYNEEYRLKLLARLPQEVLSPRRRRQVSERNCRFEPAIGQKPSVGRMASLVRSPMSAEQMTKAKDKDILNMLSQVTKLEKSKDTSHRRLFGGVEFSRAFGSFAAKCPQRAIHIILDEFHAIEHEYAASEAIESLVKSGNMTLIELRGIIAKLNQRGFASREWIMGIASAFDELARKESGLDDQDIKMLVGFISSAHDLGHDQNEDLLGDEPKKPLLFGRNGGSRVVPAGNYTVMAAVHHGLVYRNTPDCNAWADTLIYFLGISKDVETWKSLLIFHTRNLRWAERYKCNELFGLLLKENPLSLSSPSCAAAVWELSDVLEPIILLQIIQFWLSTNSPALIQVAGEFTTGLRILGDVSQDIEDIWNSRFEGGDLNFKRGAIYAASSGWYETGQIRGKSHKVLMSCLDEGANGLGIALNTLFRFGKPMPNDELTHEIITWLARMPNVIAELDGYRLISSLTNLNLPPNQQLSLLSIVRSLVDMQLSDGKENAQFEQSEELVQLSVTLQRSSGAVKEGAMQLYETLLDTGNYSAEEAADKSLRE
ncbi:AAA family ATPase [Shewanella algae]|uniref:ATP-binding protein n=1 Tax=Shewanella algae TaxID=38313 RepID=UPI001AAE5830|nr:ATP-binding protein [Shewanella algae]MBO2628173.1 AAA family ATPase [Shewanella algae]